MCLFCDESVLVPWIEVDPKMLSKLYLIHFKADLDKYFFFFLSATKEQRNILVYYISCNILQAALAILR